MGKGDKRTKRGKIFKGSHGVTRDRRKERTRARGESTPKKKK